ncbi:MAG: metal-dependent phosphohydrolase, partial [Thermoleophilia bacterium]|nr:metal-dependent phosphohydrolase [Thermoleophilia bacterium]
HHQEHYDGSGYPQRLRGENIPLGARIIAAADAYHAIRSHRPYRAGRTHQEAVQELKRCAGGQFDPQVVATLLDIMDKDEGLRALMPPDEPLTTPEARPHFPGTAAGEQTAASSPTRLSGRAAAHGPR